MREHNIKVTADSLRELTTQNGGMTAAAKRLSELDKAFACAVLARMLAHMPPFDREVFAGVLLDYAKGK
jgi:hypothetical protein